ncbi:MAG TPA: helix-hairpin-helix domain-containing protein [Chitinispirillaceae bacterium]|nr:helix-hairpin-helix domain-containing protein [Chitinispirillaceae bacterium]
MEEQTRKLREQASHLVNLNNADMEKLSRVQGIGKEMAMALIKYREKHHGFRNLDEIETVEGFDHLVAEKLKRSVYLGKLPVKTK